ncbi:MAG: hypothetical protein L3J91_02950, partial [Thermoplasmata archaeon]|nr:hypothetical protein [Thermoplasmata archaeon]
NAPVHTYTSSGAFPVELTIRYPGGTHASASTTVTAVTPLVLNGTSALTTEVGRPAVIPSTVSGGLAPYTYDWRNLPVGCTDQNASSLSCTPTSLGAFPVVETVTDPLGTTESANLVWVVVAELSVRAVVESNATGSCADPSQATVGLAASPSGGVAPFTYRWTGPGGAVRNGANAVWTVAAPSTATFNLTATDSLGVTANATVSIPTSVPSCGTTGAAAPGALALAVGAFVGVVLIAGGATFVWLRRRPRS